MRQVSSIYLLLALAWLSGCDDSQTVARVGRTSLTRQELEHFRAARSPGVRASVSDSLESLIDRALLAEAGRRQELHEDAAVQARLAAAEREILAQAMLERAAADEVSEQALRARYASAKARLEKREVHVAHVFVRLPPGASEEERSRARARISQAYARLVGDEPLEVVARELSEDEVTAGRGGDLGPVREGQVEEAFFAEAAKLAEGEVSRPFATSFGLHVVKALAAPRVVVPTFEEARGMLEAEARQEAAAKLQERLRREISVRRYPEHLPSEGRAGQPAEARRETR